MKYFYKFSKEDKAFHIYECEAKKRTHDVRGQDYYTWMIVKPKVNKLDWACTWFFYNSVELILEKMKHDIQFLFYVESQSKTDTLSYEEFEAHHLSKVKVINL